MSKLDITDQLLQDLIAEVAPQVTTVTGWELNLSTLSSRSLPKERAYEEILLSRLNVFGDDAEAEAPRGLIERLVEYVFEGSIQAAYQPNDQEILVVRENVDDSNLDGLRLTLAHELVHRGQHITYPQIFAEIESHLHKISIAAIGAASIERADPAEMQRILNAIEETRPLMVLLESHASYIQQQLAQTVFPAGRIEMQRSLPVMLFRLFGQQKISQYQEGLPMVASAAQNGTINNLFQSIR